MFYAELNFKKKCRVNASLFSAGAAERGSQALEEEDSLNYEEKAQEIVQSILQEVVSTVTGGERSHPFVL